MSLSAIERLKRFYSNFKGNDRVLCMINADPDAIASAMAIKRLLWRKVSGVSIAHVNVIERPDNLAMIRFLNVDMVHIEKVDMEKYNRFVMVDSQPDHHVSFSGIKPDVIIDHHPVSSAVAPFCDIRPEYGATASIMTEYLRAAKIKPAARLATGLFHAIKTDTANFERRTVIEDIRAFQYLYRYADVRLAQRIEQGEIKYEFLRYFDYALRENKLRKGRVFVHLGSVSNPDVCVLIADFFMRVDKINWSIISGRYGKIIVVIFRNKGFQMHAGKLAKKAFGQLGPSGGHKSMARSEFPVSAIPNPINIQDNGAVQKWIMSRILKSARNTKQKNPA